MSIAAGAGFEVFITIDNQIEHQQNLAVPCTGCSRPGRKIKRASGASALHAILTRFVYFFAGTRLYIVEGGNVLTLREPRTP
jgi:hypothetical protein